MDREHEEIEMSRLSPFEAIRRSAEDGSEYWLARDLAKILGYPFWQKFHSVIQKAEVACENSGQAVSDHFNHMVKMIELGKGAKRKVEDVYLSRYAAYLLVQNADPSKPIVALGQQYFAMQTRRQELTDQAIHLETLPEDQKRLYRRAEMSIQNYQLANTAKQAGITEARDFAIFQDHGYMGLYGGLKAKDIHARKGLKKGQEILDHMGSDELIANSFRASQTRQKLEREQIKGKEEANRTHHEVGKVVRKAIAEVGGIMPEDLPTPTKSIQQLQRDEQKRIEQQQQPTLFEMLPAPDEL